MKFIRVWPWNITWDEVYFEVHISYCEVHDSYIILLLLLLSFDLMIVQYLIIVQGFGSEFYSSSSFTLPPSLDYITLVNIE